MKMITYGLGGYDPTKPNNNIVEEVEQAEPTQLPLDPTSTLATLLAVTGTLTVTDAANAVGLVPADLIAEAEAWAAAQQPPQEQ
jgi:hypothetical protein